jgi:hypothetical protein
MSLAVVDERNPMHNTATATSVSCRGRWSALNIVLMVIGFAIFWPLGLAMLAWIIWGDEIARRAEGLKGHFRSFSERAPAFAGTHLRDTGNVAFDEYREREMKRLEEERRKLDAMRAEFNGFLKELRRAKDQEEFDRFMRDFRARTGGAGETG